MNIIATRQSCGFLECPLSLQTPGFLGHKNKLNWLVISKRFIYTSLNVKYISSTAWCRNCCYLLAQPLNCATFDQILTFCLPDVASYFPWKYFEFPVNLQLTSWQPQVLGQSWSAFGVFHTFHPPFAATVFFISELRAHLPSWIFLLCLHSKYSWLSASVLRVYALSNPSHPWQVREWLGVSSCWRQVVLSTVATCMPREIAAKSMTPCSQLSLHVHLRGGCVPVKSLEVHMLWIGSISSN